LSRSVIEIDAQCAGKFLEVLPGSIENAEFAVEDLVSQLLLEHFEEVIVDEVSIKFSPRSPEGQYRCSVHIQVRCSGISSLLSPCESECAELMMEKRVSLALAELLGAVNVERVIISPSPCENVTH
jgi:hypothetical protein